MSFLGNAEDWPHDALTDITQADIDMGLQMEHALRFRRIAAVAGSAVDGFVDSRAMAAQQWRPNVAPELPPDGYPPETF